MPKSKPKAVEVRPEIMPKPELDPFAERVAELHIAAITHASAAVYCAACAGAVMIAKKRELGHGRGFTTWKENLVLPDGSRMTLRTVDRYLALAKEVVRKLKALPHERKIHFLAGQESAPEGTENLPAILQDELAYLEALAYFQPGAQDDLRQSALAEALQDITAGQSLTELYIDWGIMRERKTGYQKHTPSQKSSTDLEREAVEAIWNDLYNKLELYGLKQQTFAFLDRADIEKVNDLLTDVKANLRKALKK